MSFEVAVLPVAEISPDEHSHGAQISWVRHGAGLNYIDHHVPGPDPNAIRTVASGRGMPRTPMHASAGAPQVWLPKPLGIRWRRSRRSSYERAELRPTRHRGIVGMREGRGQSSIENPSWLTYSELRIATTCRERAELVGPVEQSQDPNVVIVDGVKTFRPRP